MQIETDSNKQHVYSSPFRGRRGLGFTAVVVCNSFDCYAERVFRPDLKPHTVVVWSNNEGDLISSTYIANKLGGALSGQ